MATLVIGIGPKKPGDMPPGPDDQGGGYSDDDAAQEGQEIVDKVRALPVDDLQALMAGVNPAALQAMSKVDCLAPLADFLQNGGSDDGSQDQQQDAPPNGDVRSSVEMAMRKNMPPAA